MLSGFILRTVVWVPLLVKDFSARCSEFDANRILLGCGFVFWKSARASRRASVPRLQAYILSYPASLLAVMCPISVAPSFSWPGLSLRILTCRLLSYGPVASTPFCAKLRILMLSTGSTSFREKLQDLHQSQLVIVFQDGRFLNSFLPRCLHAHWPLLSSFSWSLSGNADRSFSDCLPYVALCFVHGTSQGPSCTKAETLCGRTACASLHDRARSRSVL